MTRLERTILGTRLPPNLKVESECGAAKLRNSPPLETDEIPRIG